MSLRSAPSLRPYDGLDRLARVVRAPVDYPNTEVFFVPNSTFYEYWGLTLQGNWYNHVVAPAGVSSTNLTEAYTQTTYGNQIFNLDRTDGGITAVDPTYDAAGNMVKVPTGDQLNVALYYRYDAWNRLVGIDANNDGDRADAGEVTYAYDGQGRRIQKDFASGSTQPDEDTFYNTSYQAIEVKRGTATYEQSVFDPKYVDATLVRYRDADASSSTGTLGTEETLFFTYDKQFNVTGVWDESQQAVERYSYSGYGERTVHNADLTKKTVNASTVDQRRGHQGLGLDAETGTYYNRARNLISGIGVFNGRDPLGYVDGTNLYQQYLGNSIRYRDPAGTQSRVAPVDTNFPEGKYGTTETTQRKINGKLDGAMARAIMDITFKPSNSCNCTEIAFIQFTREFSLNDMMNPHVGPFTIPTIGGWHLDRLSDSNSPFFGYNKDGSGPGGQGFVEPGSYTNVGGKNARMNDGPGNTKWSTGRIFITYIVCKTGIDAGTIYDTVQWAYFIDSMGIPMLGPTTQGNRLSPGDYRSAVNAWDTATPPNDADETTRQNYPHIPVPVLH